ncbi:hypothetical protein [Paraburkholderia fungorum]|uniref:hypothetical protein n=1 Tax=Paraburkholderia fungorum TaxID=134537 RepID=UPI0038B7DB75
MTANTVRFKQAGVLTSMPFEGNPRVVVFDAAALANIVHTMHTPHGLAVFSHA